jgi:hypothetical protein
MTCEHPALQSSILDFARGTFWRTVSYLNESTAKTTYGISIQSVQMIYILFHATWSLRRGPFDTPLVMDHLNVANFLARAILEIHSHPLLAIRNPPIACMLAIFQIHLRIRYLYTVQPM